MRETLGYLNNEALVINEHTRLYVGLYRGFDGRSPKKKVFVVRDEALIFPRP